MCLSAPIYVADCGCGTVSTPRVPLLLTYCTHAVIERVERLRESIGLVEESVVRDLGLGVVGVGNGAVRSGGGGGAQSLSGLTAKEGSKWT